MGKKRVEMKRIQNPGSRRATFSKRKNGLLKKAFELSILCDTEVALIIFSESGKINEFAGHGDMATILRKYEISQGTSGTSSSSLQQIECCQYQSEVEKLYEKMDILQRKEKNLLGEDLEALTMKEVQQLETELQIGLKNICARKMNIYSESSKLFIQKVRSLQEENRKLQTQLSARRDSSTSAPEVFIDPSLHQTSLHLGLTL